MKLDIGAALSRKGMTQSALADAIDVKKGFMSEIISGKKSPSLETLIRIATTLGVDVGDLFGGPRAKPAPEPTATASERPPGMADAAVPFDWKELRGGRPTDFISTASQGLQRPETYRVTQPIPWLAVQHGDILICDLGRPATSGDLVLVAITDRDGFNPRTSVRRVNARFAVSADPNEPDPLLDMDDHRVGWHGTICAVVRLLD